MTNLSACKYCGKLYEPKENGYACPSCTAPTPHDWKPPEEGYAVPVAAHQVFNSTGYDLNPSAQWLAYHYGLNSGYRG